MSVNSLFKPNDYTVYAGQFNGPIIGPIKDTAIAYSGVNPSDPSQNQLVIKALTTGTIGETHAKLTVVDNSGFTFGTPLGNALQGNKIVADNTGMVFSNATAGNIVLQATDGNVNIGSTNGVINLLNLPDADVTSTYSIVATQLGVVSRQQAVGYNVTINSVAVGAATVFPITNFIDTNRGSYRRGDIVSDADLPGGIVAPPVTGVYLITALVQLVGNIAVVGKTVELKFSSIVPAVDLISNITIMANQGAGTNAAGSIGFSQTLQLSSGVQYRYSITTEAAGAVNITNFPTTCFSGSLIV